jgi:hypothetical protein
MKELSRLTAGMPVTDVGNIPLGRVARVLANAFDLQLLDGSSIRLSAEALFTVDGSRASVVCGGSRLGWYRHA